MARQFKSIGFMHIPRTGGTSLVKTLKGHGVPCTLMNRIDCDSVARVDGGIFHGHFDHDSAANCRNVDTSSMVTVLRDPVSRIVSLFNYWRSRKWRAIEANNEIAARIAKTKSLDDFIRDEEQEIVSNVRNGMCRQIAGAATYGEYMNGRIDDEELAAAAIRNLHGYLIVTWPEKIAVALDVMTAQLGFRNVHRVLRVNQFSQLAACGAFDVVQPVRPTKCQVSALKSYARADYIVYDYLRDRGGVVCSLLDRPL